MPMKTARIPSLALAATMLASAASLGAAPSAGDPGKAAAAAGLGMPSPDWRDQVVYFVMTDRFDDGDPGNDDQGTGEYDPADGARYSGGDLRGIERRLDYIRGLGATALWITPPVANRWWDPLSHYGGYHGYWAEDFMRLDAHVGTLDDYRRLSRRLHAAGMYLIQDVVLNHTANYFYYRGDWDPGDPAHDFALNPDAHGRTAPTQAPFDRNDARRPADRAAAIYHWTPDIADYGDPRQRMDFQLAGLDDLNTENPVVREALRRSYGYWIREAGVDGFRVDTAFYVPPALFADFLDADDPAAPGIRRVARATGRDDFLVFGEGFALDRPFDDAQERRIDAYMRDADGRDLMPGMLNFPLYGSLADVFSRGRPPAELGYRIDSMMARFARPHLMPSFVDNHDVDRFLAGGSEAALQQALLLIMTLPGIPTVYYGTEQGFTGQRASMFAAGYGSGGRDHFDTQSPLYRYLQRAIALRRNHRVFSRGVPTVLRADAAAPGALAYRMSGDDGSALVAFNSADHATLLDGLETGLPEGTQLQGLFGIGQAPGAIVVGAGGRITLPLPPRAGMAWMAGGVHAVAPTQAGTLDIDPLPPAPRAGVLEVAGHAAGVGEFRLVVDGDLSDARLVRPGRDGRWRAGVDTRAMLDPKVRHTLVAWDPVRGAISARSSFAVSPTWKLLADVADPEGDDAGPSGRYRYPDEAGWRDRHPLDIERVRVSGSGGALRIELRMKALSAAWNPPNGFDHVAFTVFVQLPGEGGGARAMPLQHATLPGGMRWHYRLRVGGWTNALFSAAGAGDASEGTPAGASAGIDVDAAHDTIVLTLPAAALGGRDSLSGAKLYVNAWDYDGGYRPLTPSGGNWAFGGGDGADDPLWMDDTAVITLR